MRYKYCGGQFGGRYKTGEIFTCPTIHPNALFVRPVVEWDLKRTYHFCKFVLKRHELLMGGGISAVSFLFEYYGQLIYGHIPQTISYQAKVGINVVTKVSNKNYVHHSLNKFITTQSVPLKNHTA